MSEAIDKIVADINLALKKRLAINKKLGTEGSSGPFSKSELNDIQKAIKGYARKLKSLKRVNDKKSKVQVEVEQKRICRSYDARFCAVLRATHKNKNYIPYAGLVELAEEFDIQTCYHEPLTVKMIPAKKHQWRPIGLSGRKRKCQQFIIRDILLILRGDSTHDSTVAGAGGEKKLFEDIKNSIMSGNKHWVCLDIKNFFPSLRPGHLKGFPLSKWMVNNIIFLPEGTHIKFVNQKKGINVDECEQLNGFPYTCESIESILCQVRQGLIQGDICAPQIARTVLEKQLQLTLENMGVVWFSHLDDLAIGACSPTELYAAFEALKIRLNGHPAGPLEFHEHKCSDIHNGFEFLGYRIGIRKQDGVIHIRPTQKRFNRLRERLYERMETSGVFSKSDLRDVVVKYAENWYNAQQAWTKHSIFDDVGKETKVSWSYVLAEVEAMLNQFIFDEMKDGIGNWKRDDIDFMQIGEEPSQKRRLYSDSGPIINKAQTKRYQLIYSVLQAILRAQARKHGLDYAQIFRFTVLAIACRSCFCDHGKLCWASVK